MTSKTTHKTFKVFCNVHFCMFLYVYDLFRILLSCDKIMDPWNVCMYVCMYAIAGHLTVSFLFCLNCGILTEFNLFPSPG
jgi:hypothetical protein